MSGYTDRELADIIGSTRDGLVRKLAAEVLALRAKLRALEKK